MMQLIAATLIACLCLTTNVQEVASSGRGGSQSTSNAFGVIGCRYEGADTLRSARLRQIWELIEREDCAVSEHSTARKIPEWVFSNVFNADLPDAIFLVDSKGRFKQPFLLVNGKRKNDIYGKKHVWVLVLSNSEKHVKKTVPDEDRLEKEWQEGLLGDRSPLKIHSKYGASAKHVTAKLSPLNYTLGREGELFGNLVRAIGAVVGVGGIPESPKEEAVKDIEKPVVMEKIWQRGKSDSVLYGGMEKFPLNENTINRLQVSLPSDSMWTGAFATFGNYSPSRFGASIGLAANFAEGGDRDTKLHFVILGHFYLRRPLLPPPQFEPFKLRRGKSISVVAGIEMTDKDNVGDRGFVGLSVGHLVHHMGIALLRHSDVKRDQGWYAAVSLHL